MTAAREVWEALAALADHTAAPEELAGVAADTQAVVADGTGTEVLRLRKDLRDHLLHLVPEQLPIH